MPDLLKVFTLRWKLILTLTIISGVLSYTAARLSPKQYLSMATALPSNSVMADKARIFNNNVQALYSDLGSPDELDRIEGTAALDTIYIATARSFNLAGHYVIEPSEESDYKAARNLKHNSRIYRSAYGELKVKVWDKDPKLAASLANSLLQNLQQLHQHLQNQGNAIVLQKIKEDFVARQRQYKLVDDSLNRSSGSDADVLKAEKAGLFDQIQQDNKLIAQYQLALNTNPQVLLTVESARPSLSPDRPKVLETVLITLFAAFIFSFLIALFIESRKAVK